LAGAKYRDRSARKTRDGGPGEHLLIVPEPTNPVNPDALAVYTADMRQHLGYIHDSDLLDVRRALGRGWIAISAWEWRLVDGDRCAMHILIVPKGQAASLKKACTLDPI
jgi:hypothetical protein